MTVGGNNNVMDVRESAQLFLLSLPTHSTNTPIIPHYNYTGMGALGSIPPPVSLASIPLSANPHVPIAWESPQGTSAPAGVPLIQPPAPVTSVQSTDLSLSMSLRPVPVRIVQQVRSGQFVDMRDLLGDNAAVRQHFEGVHGALGFHVLPMSSRPRVREVTSLPSWTACFLTYLAVLTPDPTTRKRLAYAILVIREAMRHGGQGWLDYDRLFRQQATIDHNIQWNLVHPGLQATTILSHRSGQGLFCNLCQECDHAAQQCAMIQLQQPPTRNNLATPVSRMTSRRICTSWNEGNCAYPGSCTYRHICSRCFQPSHQARDCRLAARARRNPEPTCPPTTTTR